MKSALRLDIIRHAKSSWADTNQMDFDRPLNDRGKADAPRMATRYAALYQPTLLVSSDAVRAYQTAKHFAQHFNPIEFRKEHLIYEASLHTLVQIVTAFPAEHRHIALFGHQPGLSALVAYFAGSEHHIPTCGISSLLFHVDDWRHCGSATASEIGFIYPKDGQ